MVTSVKKDMELFCLHFPSKKEKKKSCVRTFHQFCGRSFSTHSLNSPFRRTRPSFVLLFVSFPSSLNVIKLMTATVGRAEMLKLQTSPDAIDCPETCWVTLDRII